MSDAAFIWIKKKKSEKPGSSESTEREETEYYVLGNRSLGEGIGTLSLLLG